MKTRHLLCAAGFGFGLTIILLSTLPRPNPVAQAGGTIHYYYVREGAAGDCLTVTTPCSSVVYAISLATVPGDNEVWVATGTYTENLEITHGLFLRGGWNISFTVQNPAIYTTTVEGGSATHVISANISTESLLIEGFTLRNGVDGIHLYGDAIAASGAAGGSAATVVSNTVRGADRQGIEVDGGTVFLMSNLVTGIEREGIEIDDGTVLVRGNTVDSVGRHGILVEGGSVIVEDNTIHDVQLDGYHGIRLRTDGVIRGNCVYGIADRGIDARDGAATIVDNLVHDTGGDGIRTDDSSTDVEIRGNTIYSAGNDGIDARGATVLVARNAISGCVDNGIKAEDIGSWVSVEANRVLSNATVGIAIRQAPVLTLTNNVVSDHISGSVELGGMGTGFVYHNTLVGSAAVQQGTGVSVTVTGATVALANNIVVSHTVGVVKAASAALVVSNTLLWHNGSDPISGTTVITQAPLFVAPAAGDYHLLPGSPGIDAGVDVGVRRDVDGDPRLGIPDVGADEVVRKVYLPLVMRVYPSSDRLRNPSFEGITCRPGSVPPECLDNWSNCANHDERCYDSIFTPQGWTTWWRTGGGYGQPEVKTIPNVPPFTFEPQRIRSGYYAVMLFTFYRLQDMGLYQIVTGLPPGATVQFSAYAHGWSCDSDYPMGYSCGDLTNQTFQVGIEPSGVADPFSPNIVWSAEQTSPDVYSLIGPVTAQVGVEGRVCVYLRSKTKLPYKYGDAYWDDTELVIITSGTPPPPQVQ